MGELNTISDPTDWIQTKFPFIFPMDTALRCEICKDFYTAPVITNCCHTFCSLCIRRALQADTKCPICRAEEQEYRLRRNTTVEELVDAFKSCRKKLVEFATQGEEGISKNDQAESDDQAVARRRKRRKEKEKEKARPPITVDLSEDDEEPPAPSDDGKVSCPVCTRRMKEHEVDRHLDKCIQEQEQVVLPPSPSPTTRRLRSSSSRIPTTPPLHNLKPLPKLNYSFLSDAKLRTKLREAGIDDRGNRKLLQGRYTEWLSLWNANLDSNRLRSKQELLAALRTWERAENRPTNNRTKASDWSDERWGVEYRDSFISLAEQAKATLKKRKIAAAEGSVEETKEPKGDQGGGLHSKSPHVHDTTAKLDANTPKGLIRVTPTQIPAPIISLPSTILPVPQTINTTNPSSCEPPSSPPQAYSRPGNVIVVSNDGAPYEERYQHTTTDSKRKFSSVEEPSLDSSV